MLSRPGFVTPDDLAPVTTLMRTGHTTPPRSCRTRVARDGTWRWKRCYATAGEAGLAALRNRQAPFLCGNCDFYHTGTLNR